MWNVNCVWLLYGFLRGLDVWHKKIILSLNYRPESESNLTEILIQQNTILNQSNSDSND